MTKIDIEKILSDQIAELLDFKKQNSSQISTGDYLTLHTRLESLLRAYESMFLRD